MGMGTWNCWALVPAMALACDAEPPAETPNTDRAGTVEPSDELRARPPSRGAVRGGERMRRAVRWPQPATRDSVAYEKLDDSSRAAVDQAPVPVLVPGVDQPLHERKVMQGPHWAAFWGAGEGFTVSVHASGMARVLPGVVPERGPDTLRHTDGLITRNEGIWSASWIEHGVAYALELECAPVDAPPCDSPAGVEAWTESLVYVGGRGAEVTR